MKFSNELINNTIKAWQPYCDYPLTKDDAIEIIQDMRNFAIAMINLNQGDVNGKSSSFKRKTN